MCRKASLESTRRVSHNNIHWSRTKRQMSSRIPWYATTVYELFTHVCVYDNVSIIEYENVRATAAEIPSKKIRSNEAVWNAWEGVGFLGAV